MVAEGSIDDYGDTGGQNSYSLAGGLAELHYFWLARYFSDRINGVLQGLEGHARRDFIGADGIIDTRQNEGLAAAMIEIGLAEKRGETVSLAVPLLTQAQDRTLTGLLDEVAESVAPQLSDLTRGILEAYRGFAPPRLHGQIKGVIGGYLNNAAGMVVGELEEQGIMQRPGPDELHARSVMVVTAHEAAG